MEIVDF